MEVFIDDRFFSLFFFLHYYYIFEFYVRVRARLGSIGDLKYRILFEVHVENVGHGVIP